MFGAGGGKGDDLDSEDNGGAGFRFPEALSLRRRGLVER
jgi:hypothetical protein